MSCIIFQQSFHFFRLRIWRPARFLILSLTYRKCEILPDSLELTFLGNLSPSLMMPITFPLPAPSSQLLLILPISPLLTVIALNSPHRASGHKIDISGIPFFWCTWNWLPEKGGLCNLQRTSKADKCVIWQFSRERVLFRLPFFMKFRVFWQAYRLAWISNFFFPRVQKKNSPTSRPNYSKAKLGKQAYIRFRSRLPFNPGWPLRKVDAAERAKYSNSIWQCKFPKTK